MVARATFTTHRLSERKIQTEDLFVVCHFCDNILRRVLKLVVLAASGCLRLTHKTVCILHDRLSCITCRGHHHRHAHTHRVLASNMTHIRVITFEYICIRECAVRLCLCTRYVLFKCLIEHVFLAKTCVRAAHGARIRSGIKFKPLDTLRRDRTRPSRLSLSACVFIFMAFRL